MALIGDHEREQAAELLRHHYVNGRLSVDELSDRLDLALSARRRSDVRRALVELPATWRDQVRRAAVVAAVWLAWWTASLVLLIGFVASVILQGLTVTNALLFPVLWVGATVAAVRLARRARRSRRQRFG